MDKYEDKLPQTHAELMEKPRLLISTNCDGKFELDTATVDLLSRLDTPIVVVGIAGVYRTGKSYLMNLLAGSKTGFELGATVESRTKGIWIWCRKHPTIAKTTLVVMDTEGLEDANTGDDNHDMGIMVLTLLLSSTFIFNTVGRIDNTLIKQLGFVAELSRFIRMGDENIDEYLPILVVTIRDFALELIIDGEEVSASEYFEKCLRLKESKNARNEDVEIRKKIDKYFPINKRHCCVLPQPVKNFSKMWITRVSFLPPEEMNPEFLEKSEKYLRFILKVSEPKTFRSNALNGPMFAEIASAYVEALSREKIPCIRSIFSTTAVSENTRIVKESLVRYERAVSQLELPLTQEELRREHAAIVNKLREQCEKRIVFPEPQNFDQQFKEAFALAYAESVRSNEESSRRQCEQILDTLSITINQRVARKYYHGVGGYDLYTRDMYLLQCDYNEGTCEGETAREILHKFLQSKANEVNEIVEADKSLSAEQITLEGANRVREAIERGRKLMQAELEASAERQNNLKEFFRDHDRNLRDSMEARLDQQRMNFERISTERERVHSQNIAALQHQIQNLK